MILFYLFLALEGPFFIRKDDLCNFSRENYGKSLSKIILILFSGDIIYSLFYVLRSLPIPGRFFFQKINFLQTLKFCSKAYYKRNRRIQRKFTV